jgi:hypothetical protein
LTILQIRGVKTFIEPGKDAAQELLGCLSFTLLMPQLAQTHRRP